MTDEAGLRSRVARLSLEQKVRLLTGADFWALYPEPGAGLRRAVLYDGPAGVRGGWLITRYTPPPARPALSLPGAWPGWHCRAMTVIEVVLGDITVQDVDAIVTAANESLLGGGGVDGAIHRAAGPRLAEAGAAIGPCEPGEAMATPAFDLDPPVRHIIHTVGPVWEGGGHGEGEVLASCYRRCLQVADALGARSVAFPAIATGVYGFPPEQAARIAVRTIRSTPTAVGQVRLVAFDQRTRDLLQAALSL